jgi:hypothetical protein
MLFLVPDDLFRAVIAIGIKLGGRPAVLPKRGHSDEAHQYPVKKKNAQECEKIVLVEKLPYRHIFIPLSKFRWRPNTP